MSQAQSERRLASGWRRIVEQHRIRVSVLFALVALYFARPSWDSIMLGLPVIAIGEGVRIWASGHIQKMAEVTRTGPYSLCRHPLYLGHAFITLGFLLAAANLWLLLAGMVVFLLIFVPTMDREEGDLVRHFGEEYRQYMQAVPRFIPRFSADLLRGRFDWSLVAKHREWNNVLGLIGGLIGLVLLGWWRGSL